MGLVIRTARDDDAEALIALIASCYAEYPGCVLDVDNEAPELRAIASAYGDRGGTFWVAEREGRVVGCVGIAASSDGGGFALEKLYVSADSRRHGLGARLTERVETAARERGATFVELWSDTRFENAHRLYERLGYRRGPETRELHDLSNSVEFFFRKDLGAGRKEDERPLWRRWNLTLLVATVGGAWVLFASWYYIPATRALWEAIDNAVFVAFNTSLRDGPEWWKSFVAITNHRLFDAIPALLTTVWFLKFAFDDGRRHLVKRFAAGAMIVIATVAVNRVTEMDALRFERASPSLEREDAVRLTYEITWLGFKDQSYRCFPGDHDIFLFMLVYFFWYYGGRRYGLPYLAAVMVFSLPRIMVGAHWLTDDIVGSGFFALMGIGLLFATPLKDTMLAIGQPIVRLFLGRFERK